MTVKIYPSFSNGKISAPSSKSISHRAIIISALAKGESVINNVDLSDDITATIEAVKALGAEVIYENKTLTITGISKNNIGEKVIDCNESASTLRFFIPIMAYLGVNSTFIGKGKLLKRPMDIYCDIFNKNGMNFSVSDLEIKLSGKLNSGEFYIKGDISSQFISGMLMVLPLLDGDSIIHITNEFQSKSYVDITIDVMKNFGIEVFFIDKKTIKINGNQQYKFLTYNVESDYSQLAFFAVLSAINGDVDFYNINLNSVQGDKAILKILSDFGTNTFINESNINIKKTRLVANNIDAVDIPDLVPILCVLASFSSGKTVINNVSRLRYKESNRVEAIVTELKKLSVEIISTENEIVINSRKPLEKSVTVNSNNDHRIAMALAIFACCGEYPIAIENFEAINKSYPNFIDDLKSLGVNIEII